MPAIAGTLLFWFPILATVLHSEAGIIKEHMFQLDYLMPAELFPAVLVGGGLPIWAALQASWLVVNTRPRLARFLYVGAGCHGGWWSVVVARSISDPSVSNRESLDPRECLHLTNMLSK